MCLYVDLNGWIQLPNYIILIAITNTFNSLGHKPMSPHSSGNLSLRGVFGALLELV